jgi:hypothetical protein
MFVKKTEKNMNLKPSGKLLALMKKYNIPEDITVAIGEETVTMAQELFEKWKTNYLRVKENERKMKIV